MAGVLVVTGGSRGIGAACVRIGAREGFAVCVNYAQAKDAAERLVKDIVKAGGKAIAVKADMGKRREVARVDRRQHDLRAFARKCRSDRLADAAAAAGDDDNLALKLTHPMPPRTLPAH